MRRKLAILLCSIVCLYLYADGSINIPLYQYTLQLIPMDSPTGSTPDPTDPNQFRATLTGNTLLIETQKDAVSYVVVQSDFSEASDEDYYFAISTDSVSCLIERAGTYYIRIGYWNSDFVGKLIVESIEWSDSSGRTYGVQKPAFQPGMLYILQLRTDVGNSVIKYFIVP